MLIVAAIVNRTHYDSPPCRGINKEHQAAFLRQIFAHSRHPGSIILDDTIAQNTIPPKQHAGPHLHNPLSNGKTIPGRRQIIVRRLLEHPIQMLAAEDTALRTIHRQKTLLLRRFRSKKTTQHRHTLRHQKTTIIGPHSHPNRVAGRTAQQSRTKVARRRLPRTAIGPQSARLADINTLRISKTGHKTQQKRKQKMSHLYTQ